MCIFHVVNFKGRPWLQNLLGTRMLKHQSIHKIVRFWMINEMKHVLKPYDAIYFGTIKWFLLFYFSEFIHSWRMRICLRSLFSIKYEELAK